MIEYPIPGEMYRHYKGGTYEVVTLAVHTETGENLVIYKSLNFGSVHARPLNMWSEEVKRNPVDGVTGIPTIKRFRRI